jgi:gamma-glutamylcyclotransferase (GGCT)/AIG2-like uncharacterized protein YtfP
MNKVFVYGTLRYRGSRSITTLGDTYYVGGAITKPDWQLWDLGQFPALVPGGQDIIVGEVWEVDDELMRVLDQIEGYPTLYRRQLIETDRGTVWAYYMPDPEQYGGELITSEDGVIEWKETEYERT